METLRTFVALPLSLALHTRLGQVQESLRRVCPDRCVRWVQPHSIHLTLFFLGDVGVERLDEIKIALRVAARHIAPFDFVVGGLGVFPNPKRPRVVWVGVQESTGRLSLLHATVNEVLVKVGFTPEERDFKPHLTLGRLNQSASAEQARQVGEAVLKKNFADLAAEQAAELVLFRSELKASGAEYTPLATFRLGD